MKNLLLIINMLFLVMAPAAAQKKGVFQGRVVYKIEYAGENSTMMSTFGPSSYEYKITDKMLKMKMNGGMASSMMGDILVDGKKQESYMLQSSEKVAYKFETESDDASKASENTSVTLTGEKQTIMGYVCDKYKVTIKTDEGTVTQYVWATKDLKVDMGYSPDKNIGAAGQLFMKEIDGMPLKIETKVPGMNMTLTMTASEIEWKTYDKSEFVIPAGYIVKKFDAKAFGAGMKF